MIMPLRSVSDLYPYSDFSQHPGLPIVALDLDIEPNDPANYVETEGIFSDKVRVAVLTTSLFDATSQVDTSALQFGPNGTPAFDSGRNKGCRWRWRQ